MPINSADLNKEMYVGHMEVWTANLKKPKREFWPLYSTKMKSTRMEETYDTLGNLPKAKKKLPGQSISYGKAEDCYETTVKNETTANGFSIDLETYDDDQYNIVDEFQVNDLYSTMITAREEEVAAVWNNIFTAVGADGKAGAASDHPLKNSAAVNDNLASGLITPDNVILAAAKFNSIKKQNGSVMDTDGTAILAHKDKMATIQAVLASNLKAMESSNTKNTVPNLKMILSKYLSAAPWHILDEAIASVIMQIRSGLKTHSEFDAKDTLVWYFNAYERYKAAKIHDGYGHVSSPGT